MAPATGAVVGSLPPALAALPPGQRLPALVEAPTAGGGVRLSTPYGPLTVAAAPPPPRGTAVMLVLQQTAAGPMAKLLPPAVGGNGATGAAHGAGTTTIPRLATATLLTPLSWSETATATATSPSGSAAGAAVAAAPVSATRTLPAGSLLVVRWTDRPPTAGGAGETRPATVLTPGSRHAGEIIGTVGGNRTMIRVAGGVIAVDGTPAPSTRAPMLEIVRLAGPTTATPMPAASPPPGDATSRWPALSEAAALIFAADQRGNSALRGDVLRPDRDLAAALLRFLAALGGDDGAGWPSPAAQRLLDRRAPTLLPRVAEEMREATRLFEPPTPGDWRSAILPFVTPDGTRTLRFSRRGGRQGQTADGAPAGTRFMVDIRLSRLGRVQLDGLVPADARRFELMVRTEAPLPGDVRDTIRAVFAEATALGGLGGALGFQASPESFIEVEAREPLEGGGIFA